jgi:lipopolysaccharide/colanic/teichoic acid biosynthesis glycosyltransferase
MSIAELPGSTTLKSASKSTATTTECMRAPLSRGWYFRAKEVADRLLAIVLLALATPVIALLVVAVRCSSLGPGLYRQVPGSRDKAAAAYPTCRLRLPGTLLWTSNSLL